MKPIRIEIWKRTDVHTWSMVKVLSAGTWGKARALAKKAMGPVVTTNDCYHRDLARAPFAKLVRRPKHDISSKSSNSACPDVHFVPSVGELGYW